MAGTKIFGFDAANPPALGTGTPVVSINATSIMKASLEIEAGLNYAPNSRFNVWSHYAGTEYLHGSDIVTNGAFTSDASGWGYSDCTLASVSSQCVMTRTGGDLQMMYQNLNNLLPGVVYKVCVSVQSGTAGNVPFYIQLRTSNAQHRYKAGTTSGVLTEYTVYFMSTLSSGSVPPVQATAQIQVVKNDATAGTMIIDTISCTPCGASCVANNSFGPDGWQKTDATFTTYPKLYQEYIDKPVGAVCSLKMVGSATEATTVHNNNELSPIWFIQWRGKSVVFGAWVKSDAASQARLYITDSAATTYSSYNTTTGWEFLTVTQSISSTTTKLTIGLYVVTNKTAYFALPVFKEGVSIASSNCVRPRRERIYLEVPIFILNAATIASGTSYLQLAEWSNLAIPGTIRAIGGYITAQNTAANKYLRVYDPVGSTFIRMFSQVANVPIASKFDGPILPNYSGAIYFDAEDANWSAINMVVTWIEFE